MKCGGVMALDEDPGHLEEHIVDWIKYARPAKEAIDSEQAELEEAARHRAIVERNTLLQVENLKSYPVVQEAMEKGELKLHAWLYELENGYVRYYDAINGGYVFP
jgi:carbonic anhydrase